MSPRHFQFSHFETRTYMQAFLDPDLFSVSITDSTLEMQMGFRSVRQDYSPSISQHLGQQS